jgi:hypothetical protein
MLTWHSRTSRAHWTNQWLIFFVLKRRAKYFILVENCALLGHYAAGSGNSLPTFRDNLSVLFWKVNKSWPFKMGPIFCPERSVGITITCCVVTQKSAVPIYFAVETWSHEYCRPNYYNLTNKPTPLYELYNSVTKATNPYMLRTFLACHHGVPKLYRTTVCYICLLYVEWKLLSLPYRKCVRDGIMHSHLDQRVEMSICWH